jgi:hypothetical protein
MYPRREKILDLLLASANIIGSNICSLGIEYARLLLLATQSLYFDIESPMIAYVTFVCEVVLHSQLDGLELYSIKYRNSTYGTYSR